MSRLARLSLANRSIVALATIAVIAFGLVATVSLKQELLPSLQLPVAVVSTPYPGASPEIVEREITEPIEAAIQGTDGLSGTTSTSSNGFSLVQAEFDYGTDIDAATQALREAASGLAGQLPQGAEPQVLAGNLDDLPVVLLAASATGDDQKLAEALQAKAVPELESIAGVRSVEVTGARAEQVLIELDQRKLAASGLSAGSVTAALQANGVTVPGGSLTSGNQRLSLDIGSQFSSVEDLASLPLLPTASPGVQPAGAGTAAGTAAGTGAGAGAGGGNAAQAGAAGTAGQRGGSGQAARSRRGAAAPRPVKLSDVAEVRLEPQAATSITRTDGRPSLGVSVTKTVDGNTVSVSNEVRDRIPALQSALGAGSTLTVVFDQAPFIEQSVEGLTTEGLFGLAFAVLVILVFLLSLRSTIVTAVSIPLSLLVAMLGLWTGGYSLNILTLGALTVAVGRVVDDSIVVLENIKRHLGYGEEKRAAILAAVGEVAGAVTASTATTVAVFLPIAFVGGQVGELFRPFAVTVTIALAASLLVALTVIPVLAYWFLRSKQLAPAELEQAKAAALKAERRSPLQRVYVPLIAWTTRRRAVTILLGVAIFIGTLALIPRLQTNFFDRSGQNTVNLTQELPPGASLERTDAAARQVERVLEDLDGVESYQVTIGASGGGRFFAGGAATNQASYSITTHPEIDQKAFTDRLRARLDGLAGAGEMRIADAGAGFGGSSLEVIVQAQDPAVLRDAAGLVERAVAGIGGATDVVNNLAEDEPGVRVTPDRAKAAAVGLSDAQIGQAVRQAFEGQQAGTILVGGEPQDVVIRGGDAPGSLDAVRRLTIPTPAGGAVRLGDVAEVAEVTRPAQLTRTDGERSATITASPSAEDVGAVSATLQQRLGELRLPAGASYRIGGVSAEQRDAFGQLGLALVAAVIIVFMVMVATFGSLVQPLILLVSVPFAATGAIGLLLLTGTALGAPALIGLLMLVGIVVTNAIVLIDLINQYRAQGHSVHEAVVEGARQRLRPVLMTAVATICALLPMALGLTGGGMFISRPLAIVVIGGLVSSTLLTLVLVPTLYTMVEDRRERRRQRREPRPAPSKREEAVPAAN